MAGACFGAGLRRWWSCNIRLVIRAIFDNLFHQAGRLAQDRGCALTLAAYQDFLLDGIWQEISVLASLDLVGEVQAPFLPTLETHDDCCASIRRA